MKGQSDNKPDNLVISNGKTQVNYNVTSEEVTDEHGTHTVWKYDIVEVEGKVTKAKIIEAMKRVDIESDSSKVIPDDIFIETEETKINKGAIKTAYLNAITTLQNIQTTTSYTNAQVVAAVKAEANILEKLLKFMKSQIN